MPKGESGWAESDSSPESLSFPAVRSVLEGWREVPRAGDPRHKAFAEAAIEILDEEAAGNGYQTEDSDSIELEAVDMEAVLRASKKSLPARKLTNLLSWVIDFQSDPYQLGMAHEPLKTSLQTPLQAADLFLRSMNYIGLLTNNQRLMEIWLKTGSIGELPNFAYEFPADFDKKEAWRELFDYVLSQEHPYEDLEYSLLMRRVQTNIPGRYKGLHMPLDLIRERIPPEGIRWLDIGPSIGQGVREELSDEPYSHIHIFSQISEPQLGANIIYPVPHTDYMPEISQHFNASIDEKIKIKEVWAVDITGVHPSDYDQVIWVKACHYTSELNNPLVMERFDRLVEFEDPRMNFSRVDCSNDDSVDNFIKELNTKSSAEDGVDLTEEEATGKELREKFHVVTIFTVLNQLSDEDRVKVINNALRMLAPGGVILVQDFAQIDPNAPSGLNFLSSWPDYTYGLYMIDPSVSLEPQLVGYWKNGRCDEMFIPEDSILSGRG